MKKNPLDYTVEALAAELSEPKYRGTQVYEWLKAGVFAFLEMSNLPKTLRERLDAEYDAEPFKILKLSESKDGTKKLLGAFLDGETVESVLMHYKYGYSACISTQVGCKMGCEFCATAKCGFARNLTSGEMLGQIYQLTKLAGRQLSNIVLMGMGEPLDNYDAVVDFIRRVSDPKYYGISTRGITLSTCGLVDGIERLAREGLPVTLAISLHNPFQRQREEIMPVARSYDVNAVLDAARHYSELTGRRITIEYALIEGENDSNAHARELIEHVMRRGREAFHINIIPMNDHELTSLRGTGRKRAEEFLAILEASKVGATIRRQLGSDIDAACGQLKNKTK